MKKRWLSLAVAATAAITVLAGCGSKAAETTAAATEAATTEAASSEAAESSAEETKAEAAAEGEIPAPEGDDNKISIGVTPVPHAEIVNDVVVPKLEAAGWDVEVVEFNDYVQPNTSLEDGEIDANYFQTIRYLEEQNKERGLHLVEVAGIHLSQWASIPRITRAWKSFLTEQPLQYQTMDQMNPELLSCQQTMD